MQKSEYKKRVKRGNEIENDLIAASMPSNTSDNLQPLAAYIQKGPKTRKNEDIKYYCEYCEYDASNKYNWNRHILTAKHKKGRKAQESVNQNETFYCKDCDYSTSRESKWDRHLQTNKHKYNQNVFECVHCSSTYTTRNGLIAHVIKCKYKCTQTNDDKELILEQNQELARKNQELTKQIIEICTNMKPSSIITNNNSNNKTFNLNFFLNETCKNAMSMQDFVSSIQLQLSDLEETGRLGFSGGISNIITNSLNKMETEDRPMHCTDSKRETIYIKNDNEWQKDENKEQLTSAIKQIARKNSQNILPWRELNPGCCNSSSRKNDQYLKIVGNAMVGGDQAEIKRNIDKIVSNIAKQIIINK